MDLYCTAVATALYFAQRSLGSRVFQAYPQKQKDFYTYALVPVKFMRSSFVARLIIGHK